MEKKFGLVLGLLIGTVVALSYFLFCPHAGRNARTVEVHMHVIPIDVPQVRLQPQGELPKRMPEIPDKLLEEIEKQQQ